MENLRGISLFIIALAFYIEQRRTRKKEQIYYYHINQLKERVRFLELTSGTRRKSADGGEEREGE